MATTLTFTTLKEDIVSYLDRGMSGGIDKDVEAQLPRLINNAERRIARELKVEGFVNVVTSTMVAGVAVYAKPDRWRRTLSVTYGKDAAAPATVGNKRTPVFARSYEYARNYWPDDTKLDAPEFYSDYDYQHWLVTPTPDANYPYEIVYHEQPRLLDDTNQENWLTQYLPRALLYASLLEATPFLRNDERIPTWQQFYAEEMGAVNSEDLKRIVDRATTRQEA